MSFLSGGREDNNGVKFTIDHAAFARQICSPAIMALMERKPIAARSGD